MGKNNYIYKTNGLTNGEYYLYQGIQSLLDYKREVTWGNTVATFRDTLPKTFGHEFGHIIQFNTQGWAAFQGRGISNN